MRFFEGTRTREQAVAQILESQGWYDRVGFHLWAAILREHGRFIGRCGTYRYLNMDQVVAQSLKSAEDFVAGRLPAAGAEAPA